MAADMTLAHALLGASSANRWINCPPSARLGESIEDTTSVYAEEGTVAHAMAELKALKHFTTPMGAKAFNKAVDSIPNIGEFDRAEIDRYTTNYLDYLKEIGLGCKNKPHVAIEKKIDYSHHIPGGFGTVDCLMLDGETLHVIDFKYGKGIPISAENNEQMMLYALGAILFYGVITLPSNIILHIAQPRLDNFSTWAISTTDLMAWVNNIAKPAALLADKGEGEFSVGDHCKWCKVKCTCRARAEKNLELAKHEFVKPATLSLDEVGDILLQAQDLAKWVKDVTDYAKEQALKGENVKGWKIVEGRRDRTFIDTDRAFKLLVKRYGIAEASLYKRSPEGIGVVENLLGKDLMAEFSKTEIYKPEGKPTFVVATDKREPYKVTSARKEFEIKKEEI